MGYVGATLTEQSIHEGGLAMVNMSNHGDVAEAAGVQGAAGFDGGCGRGGREGAEAGVGSRQ